MTEIYKIYFHRYLSDGVFRFAGCYILGIMNTDVGGVPTKISILKGKVIVGFTNGETHEFGYDPNDVEIFRRPKQETDEQEIPREDN